MSRILLAAALFPALWSSVSMFRTPTEQPVSGHIERPSLVFDQYLVNYGEVPSIPVVHAHFGFTNTGDQPVTIDELKPSCGCLAPRLRHKKRTYQPGERGVFEVGVPTANEEPGLHDYTIRVAYADSQPREETLHFRLTLPDHKVSVIPSELFFYQLSGEPDSRTIEIIDRRQQPLSITGVQTDSELVTGTVGAARTDADGTRRIPVEISVAGNVPSGRQDVMIRLETDDPEFRRLLVRTLVHGPVESKLRTVSFEETAEE